MELEKMKEIWSDLDKHRQQVKPVSDDQILAMTHRRSRSRLERIILMESIGSVASVAMVVFLILYFHRLENWLQIIGGIGTIAILLTGILLALRIIRQARRINLAEATYQQNLDYFAALKRTLRLYKRISIVLNMLLPFLMLPVVFKLLLGRDLLNDLPTFGKTLLLCAALAIPALILIIRYYRKSMTQVRKALERVDNITDKNDEK